MRLFIDFHALQSVPPSNMNRDETGAPKSAFYGGVSRARVSSQALKRAERAFFEQHIDEPLRSQRTLQPFRLIVERVERLAPDMDEAERRQRVLDTLKLTGLKVTEPKQQKGETELPARSAYQVEALAFLSNQQLDALADLALSDEPTKKAAKEAINSGQGAAIALFGRMVASSTDLNVNAAAQVAHALSTHAVDTEPDFFTAVDDAAAESSEADRLGSGAGMMGTIEFNSSTLYRYANINAPALAANLGDDEVAAVAVREFARAFALAMPTGKANTFANQTVPEFLLITLRRDRPVSLVGAFETPIAQNRDGYVTRSIEALIEHYRAIENAYGLPSESAWIVSLADGEAIDAVGTRVSLPELLAELETSVRASLQAE